MKIKPKLNKTPLFVGIMLIVIGELADFIIPAIDLNNASFYEAYQQLWAVKFWAGMRIIGWNICFIWGIIYLVRNRRQRSKCKNCGAKIISKEDIFCRECGVKL